LASVSVFLLELENSLAGARIDMPKKKLSRAKMCKEVLAAIQEYPGCKAVKEVAISEVADTAADSVWRVTVIDCGGVEFEKANHAARDAQDKLRQQYELMTGT
jgi:hypothetical protein